MIFRRTVLLFFLYLVTYTQLFAYEECDSLRHCTLRALTLSVTYGKGAHYIDVDRSPAQNTIKDQLTVELWMNVTRQPGKKQFIAGRHMASTMCASAAWRGFGDRIGQLV